MRALSVEGCGVITMVLLLVAILTGREIYGERNLQLCGELRIGSIDAQTKINAEI